jgi:phage gpG-like protein
MTTAKITVTGLREFQAAIRAMDADLPKQIRLVLNESAELIIDYAGSHMTRRSGAAAASLRPRSTQREARIALGGRRAPYAPWLDFGGQGRRKGRPPLRPYLKEGRYVYRGLAVHRADITQRMSKALTDLAHDAGLEAT